MRAIVTGGAGFIGSHLVDMLIGLGYEVLIIDNLSTGRRENVNPNASFYHEDIRKFWRIWQLFKDVDYVFHCAALARVPFSIEKPYETHMVNVEGTINVLHASALAGVKKVIHSSSSSVYGNQTTLPFHEDMIPNPVSPYGRQKRYIEEFCRDFMGPHHLKIVCLRYFNVYGSRCVDDHPYSLVIGKFLKNKKEGETSVIYGDGNQSRDFTHVSDVVLANIRAMESSLTGLGEAINIGAGKNYTINQLAKTIGGSYDWVPAPSARQGECLHTLADITKAKELLDWKPAIGLFNGITELKKLNGLA